MAGVITEKAIKLVVEKSDDLRSATISVQPGGIKPEFTTEDIVSALESEKIKLTDATRARAVEFFETFASSDIPDNFLIAEGTPPQGRDELFIWSDKYSDTQSDWQEDAPVDFYSLNNIITVEKDDVFGTTEPPIPAAPGMNIEGEAIPATCSPKTLKLDSTIVRSADDPSKLVAAISGTVVQEEDNIRIDEVLFVNGDVSFESGNVDSTVDVHIKGRVPDRFEVVSRKSVTVGRAIEAARVSAGRNVTVCNGIAARRTGLVTAGGSITAKYCSDANLVAGGDIKIAKQAMNSQMCTEGKFLGEAASMIGGSLLASGDVRLLHTGSQRNIVTRVVTGIKPEVIREAASIDHKIKRAGELVEKLTEMLNHLDPAGVDAIDGGTKAIEEMKSLIAKSKKSVTEEQERMEKLLGDVYTESSAKVYVSGTIFSGTRIRIGDRRVVFHQEHKGPSYIEKRKIENVTELVVVNTLSGSIKILTNEKRDAISLLEGFELEDAPTAMDKPVTPPG